MVNVTPTWAPVRTDVPRQDRRPCHDLPSVRPGVACRAGRWRPLDGHGSLLCPPSLSLCSGLSGLLTYEIRRKGRGHEAQGCERGVGANWIDLHAPVTSRPTLSRGLAVR